MSSDGEALFREQQRFGSRWLWLIVLASIAPIAVVGHGLYEQAVVGVRFGARAVSTPLLEALFAGEIAIVAFILWVGLKASLTVAVHHGCVLLQFAPFHRRPRRIDLDEVTLHEAVTYSPLGDYGGYGIRGFKRNRAYNVSGDRGVKLYFRDGRKLLIGTQQPDALAAAITRALRR